MVTATHTSPTAPAPSPEIIHAPETKKFRISGPQFKAVIKDLSEEQQAPLWWLFQYCHRKNIGKDQHATLLKKPNGFEYYSADSVGQIFGGGRIRRGENLEPMLVAIRSLQQIEDARSEMASSGFIQTRLFDVIEKRCMRALHRQKIMFIFGDSQIGKTENLLEVQRRHNHGQTIYVETPSTGSLSHFLMELAGALNIPKTITITRLVDEIIATFDKNMLLIVDEAHRTVLGRKSANGSAVMNFLRELWNKTKCGIVISMTNEGRDELLQGTHKKCYQQIWRRRISPLQLPKVTPADDLALFAAAYGLPEATETPVTVTVTAIDDSGRERQIKHTDSPLNLQTQMNQTEGLGVWISILQDASDMALEQKRKITWGAVIKATCQAQADAEILN